MAASKQCSKCGEGYDYDLKSCPGCGYQGYKLLQIDTANVKPIEPSESPIPPKTNLHPDPILAAMGIPHPDSAPAESTETEPELPPALPVFTWITAGVMTVSLFMVWAQVSVAEADYFRLFSMVWENLDGAIDMLGIRAMGILLPGLTAFGMLAQAGWLTSGRRVRQSYEIILGVGFAGLLAAWQTYDYVSRAGSGFFDLTGILGPGFKLYTVTAAVAVGIGIWGLSSMRPSAENASAAAAWSPLAKSSKRERTMVIAFIVFAGIIFLLSLLVARQ